MLGRIWFVFGLTLNAFPLETWQNSLSKTYWDLPTDSLSITENTIYSKELKVHVEK